MTALWPCRCGAPGVQNLCAHGYCAHHLGELLESFDPSAFTLNGRWLQDGCMRPDHGEHYAECRCLACGAGAVAVIGSPCGFCEAARERLVAWQRERLLRPELPDPDDARYEAAALAWARRLARAATAEIVTEAQARAALARVGGGRRVA